MDKIGLGEHGAIAEAEDHAPAAAGATVRPHAATYLIDDVAARLKSRGKPFDALDRACIGQQFTVAIDKAEDDWHRRRSPALSQGCSRSCIPGMIILHRSPVKTAIFGLACRSSQGEGGY